MWDILSAEVWEDRDKLPNQVGKISKSSTKFPNLALNFQVLTEKKVLGSALGRPEGTSETGFSMPGGKIPPKKSPGGSQIEVQKRSGLKIAKPGFLTTVARIPVIFEVQGPFFGAQSGSKMWSESHLRRGSPQKASWRPLGTLLEPLGAEKSHIGIALGRSWRPLKTGFNKKEVQTGTPIRGLKWDPLSRQLQELCKRPQDRF